MIFDTGVHVPCKGGSSGETVTYQKIYSREMTQQTFVGLPDVLKTSSTTLQRNNFTSSKTSWRRLGRQKIFTLKTPWRHVLKTSWRHVLKTYWIHILKTSSRLLGGKKNVCWWYLYLTNLNVYLTKLCFANLYLTDLRRIQNALLRTR